MTFRIDRTRGPTPATRAANDHAEPFAAKASNLPVPVGPAAQGPRVERCAGEAGFSAQLLGQDGQKRGLRAGEPFISAAKRAYDRTEWSGSKDRRSRQGRKARTDV